MGIDLDLVKRWHHALALGAELGDPLSAWREVVRYATREKRLTLKGRALQGEEGYYQAEVLRRYVEYYHGVTDLPDEDLVRLGPQVPVYKQRIFGATTTTDGDRSVFRNVVRQYGLDLSLVSDGSSRARLNKGSSSDGLNCSSPTSTDAVSRSSPLTESATLRVTLCARSCS